MIKADPKPPKKTKYTKKVKVASKGHVKSNKEQNKAYYRQAFGRKR